MFIMAVHYDEKGLSDMATREKTIFQRKHNWKNINHWRNIGLTFQKYLFVFNGCIWIVCCRLQIPFKQQWISHRKKCRFPSHWTGVGVIKLFPPFQYFQIFQNMWKHCLPTKYRVLISRVWPHPTLCNTWERRTPFSGFKLEFCHIEQVYSASSSVHFGCPKTIVLF